MRTVLAVLAVVFLVAADEKPGKKDQDAIQGTWKVESALRGGKAVDVANDQHLPEMFTFAGQAFTIKGQGRELKGTFHLDPATKPKAIDLKSGDNPDRVLKAIYVLDGDTLKLGVDESGMDRPTALESKEGTQMVVAVFKRQKK